MAVSVRQFARAFTLIEVLVVIAIISILAAVLFPVFQSAKSEAYRANCQSNLHQISAGLSSYVTDYDDHFMPINYQPAGTPNSRNDRTWVQMLLPYLRNFDVFHCPADFTARPTSDATFDQDLVPGDTDSQYYTASLHADYGYNYQNLAPILLGPNGGMAEPRESTQVAEPSNTIAFLDSVWNRSDGGQPYGGGNWLVVPPCRYYESSPGQAPIDSFTGSRGVTTAVFTNSYGWSPNEEAASNVYGGAWPWHNGRINVVNVDSSIRSLQPSQLSTGCDVRGHWNGLIRDAVTYSWDLR